MLRVEMRLAEGAGWLTVFDPRDSTLFVAAPDPPEIGAEVRIDLHAGSGGPHVIFRGKVIAHRSTGSRPGYCVALGPYEREKINYLNGFVRGGLLDLRNRRRLPIRLALEWRSADRAESGHSRDINEEGIFVVTERPLPEGTEVELFVEIPGQDDRIAMAGVVTHTVLVEDEDVPGMGIQFYFAAGQRDSLSAVIDELHRRFAEGDLPDSCLL